METIKKFTLCSTTSSLTERRTLFKELFVVLNNPEKNGKYFAPTTATTAFKLNIFFFKNPKNPRNSGASLQSTRQHASVHVPALPGQKIAPPSHHIQ